MKIRLSGTPAELDAGVDIIRQAFTVTYTSRLYPMRGTADRYSVHFEIKPPEATTAPAPTPRAVAARVRRRPEEKARARR